MKASGGPLYLWMGNELEEVRGGNGCTDLGKYIMIYLSQKAIMEVVV